MSNDQISFPGFEERWSKSIRDLNSPTFHDYEGYWKGQNLKGTRQKWCKVDCKRSIGKAMKKRKVPEYSPRI